MITAAVSQGDDPCDATGPANAAKFYLYEAAAADGTFQFAQMTIANLAQIGLI